MSALRILKYGVLAGILGGAIGTTRLVSHLGAQGTTTGIEALQKAHVLERLVEAIPPSKGTAPSFVLDPIE